MQTESDSSKVPLSAEVLLDFFKFHSLIVDRSVGFERVFFLGVDLGVPAEIGSTERRPVFFILTGYCQSRPSSVP